MDIIKLRPEKELKTLWIITWIVVLLLGIIFCLFFILTFDLWIIGVSIFGWIIIMIPVLIWIPAAFKALEYYIDDEGVKMKGGVVWKKHVTVPYSKITNVDVTRGPMQRYYNIGTIHVQTAGAGGQQGQKAELKINGVRELEKIRDIIIKKVKDSSYYPGRVKESVEKSQPFEKVSVFDDILNELKEIKMLLEKR